METTKLLEFPAALGAELPLEVSGHAFVVIDHGEAVLLLDREVRGAEGDFLAGAEGAFRFLTGGFRGNDVLIEALLELFVGVATPGEPRRGKGKFFALAPDGQRASLAGALPFDSPVMVYGMGGDLEFLGEVVFVCRQFAGVLPEIKKKLLQFLPWRLPGP